ncbi:MULTISPECIES: phage tail assembly chaperone [unclassified Pseudomonas]|uniref:phage tail assembly chaperone n=1 Tax=unclassified Pseudomonas TaxID=196821 RepID=UPI001F58EFBD|nr:MULTISPECIES: phage tail assembly chaperone [unclassified Pseudomonas]
MAVYARIENGVVVERIDTGDYAISELFAPSFVESMVRVPDDMTVDIGALISELTTATEPPPGQTSPVILQAPVVAEQGLGTVERTWREMTLSATEWLVTRHRDEQELGRGTLLKAAQYLELLEYRQALRDWPDSVLFPAADSRPSAPLWLASVIG